MTNLDTQTVELEVAGDIFEVILSDKFDVGYLALTVVNEVAAQAAVDTGEASPAASRLALALASKHHTSLGPNVSVQSFSARCEFLANGNRMYVPQLEQAVRQAGVQGAAATWFTPANLKERFNEIKADFPNTIKEIGFNS